MDLQKSITLFEQHALTIQALTRGLTTEQARWKPNANAWSILEVINHLYDEEREDFRARLDKILFHPTEPWEPIHPTAWVTERAYNARELDTSVNSFLTERENSLRWLKGLNAPDWEAAVTAPWGGEFKAGDMFSSWVTHDVLHLRQLVELHYALVQQNALPYEIGYAGDW